MWRLPDEFLSKEAFLQVIPMLEMTSSPGFPYMKEAPTNGQWLGWNGIEADPLKIERLWWDTQEVLHGDWRHILKVFVKQEPHKIAKADEGRWRLIMASSLPVQCAWHMLFNYVDNKEIEECFNIPSQHGAILVHGGWQQYVALWKSLGLTSGLDKRAWDWTCPYWMIKCDLELRYRLGRGKKMGTWLQLARKLYHHMFVAPELLMSDGTVFRQTVPGIVKSGCVVTISLNGHCQVFGHCGVSLVNKLPIHPLPKCCGDDTLQHENHVQDVEAYKQFGIQIKSVSSTMEFMGHEFRDAGPYPMYVLKHLKKLGYVSDENMDQYLDSMARLYCHTEYYTIWETMAELLDVVLPLSQAAYRFWYDTPED